jgi:hypothetical protein
LNETVWEFPIRSVSHFVSPLVKEQPSAARFSLVLRSRIWVSDWHFQEAASRIDGQIASQRANADHFI